MPTIYVVATTVASGCLFSVQLIVDLNICSIDQINVQPLNVHWCSGGLVPVVVNHYLLCLGVMLRWLCPHQFLMIPLYFHSFLFWRKCICEHFHMSEYLSNLFSMWASFNPSGCGLMCWVKIIKTVYIYIFKKFYYNNNIVDFSFTRK